MVKSRDPLQPYIAHSEDGSTHFEWIEKEWRLGIVIDPNPQDSSWFLVTMPSMGGIHATGSIQEKGLDKLLRWLLNFVWIQTGNSDGLSASEILEFEQVIREIKDGIVQSCKSSSNTMGTEKARTLRNE